MNKNDHRRISFTCTCLRSYDTLMSFKPLFKEGFGGIEIFYPYEVSEQQKEDYTKGIRDLIQDEDLTMIMHLPYGVTSDLARNDDEAYAKEVYDRYKKAIDYGKMFGVDRFTLHLGYRKNGSFDALIDRVKGLCDYAYPAYIMIENRKNIEQYGVYEDELEQVFSLVNKPNLKFIYDTGHGHAAHNNTVLEKKLIDDFKDRLYHFHIQDNDGTKVTHGKIGSGNVEFETIFSDLKKNNYEGLFSLEVLFNTVDDLRAYGATLKTILKHVGIIKE